MLTCVTDPMPASSARERERPTVLLIDDDAEMLESLAMVLQDHGFRVLTAPDGHRGLQMFREHEPAAVLTDIIMPEEDGIGTMLQIRRERPETTVIVISGQVESWDYLGIAQRLGADAVFEKGGDTRVLLETLDRLLTRGSATSALSAGGGVGSRARQGDK
jgi:DNA-binding response OmpR family regulator